MKWIISANPEGYYHDKSFEKNGFIDWNQYGRTFSIGDVVYVYVSKTLKRIVYKTVVEKVNLTVGEYIDDSEFWIGEVKKADYKVRLRLIEEVNNDGLSLKHLESEGFDHHALQAPVNISINYPAMEKYVDSFFSSIVSASDKAIETAIQKIDSPVEETEISGKEREAFVKTRVNQGVFRERMLSAYNKKCCLCEIDDPSLLIASHIKPWADCEKSEKLQTDNGLLLCLIHDKLFDLGYISFDYDGSVLLSEKMTDSICDCAGFSKRGLLNFRLVMNVNKARYMEYHRNYVFIDNK